MENCNNNSCSCCHDEEEELSLKGWLISLAIFIVLWAIEHFYSFEKLLQNFGINNDISKIIELVVWGVFFIAVSHKILIGAVKNLFSKKLFDELFLMSVASICAFCLGEYSEAVAVILFYQLGDYFCDLGEEKSKRNLSSLLSLQPEKATKIEDGKNVSVLSSELKKDDLIVIMAGDRVPVDCRITSGSSFFDTSSLTGESTPIKKQTNDQLLSGSMNISGSVTAIVLETAENSTASRMISVIEEYNNSSSERERFITKFSHYYTPIVVFGAILLFLIGSLITKEWMLWLHRALNFLVISCPCALVISVPLTYFMGMGTASKKGILIKGASYIDDLDKVSTICFDKTGTLTKETLNVIKFIPSEKENELLNIALKAECASKHPIALTVQKACTERGIETKSSYPKIEEVKGKGIVAYDEDSSRILLGNKKLLQDYDIQTDDSDNINTVINVAKDDKLIGQIVIGDELKPEAKETVDSLKKMNIHTIMLTGDREVSAKNISSTLGIDSFKSSLLPLDKVAELEKLLKVKCCDNPHHMHKKVAFVGDGINDTAVLLKADVGITLGGISSDSAIQSSSVVLVNPSLKNIVTSLKLSHKIIRIVKQNIALILFVKLLILVLSVFGIGGIWLAIFGDVGLSVLAVLNALRA